MRGYLRAAFLLIVAYLILVHFTGFSRDVGALAQGTVGTVKAFQGR
jgi:predicted anti-sigma-YlaC factor YlaD